MKKGIIIGTVLVGILLCLPAGLFSQQREKISINEHWDFLKNGSQLHANVDWESPDLEKIDLPHTWNNKDVLDETPGYYRGIGWYRKTITLNKGWEKQRLFLEFEAANQLAEVFINGNPVGTHSGGYSAFRFDITGHMTTGENNFELCVRVDNSFNQDIPPLTADFTFFGGIYRDVWLIYAPQTHFSLDHYGGAGVYWQTPSVNHESAGVIIFGFVSNYSPKNTRFKVEHILLDHRGAELEKKSIKQNLKPGKNLELKPVSFTVKSPVLWSTESPHCYSMRSRLIDSKSGEVIDEITNPIGFRWFEFSADNGFFLNGKHMKIRGISRHQDYPGMGNALSREQHIEDVLAIKDMGGNFLRIAHYPQDQDVITACDTTGLLTSVEIPIVNRITESEEFTRNSLLMMEEMIWQNYNHPGLIMWTYMNEVLLRPPFPDDTARLEVYYSNVTELAVKLEQTARQLDPYRVTMIPNHGAFNRYKDAGLTEIPMLVGWNLYHGWYGANFTGFEKYLDMHHLNLPDKPLIITEYGAGHDPRLISFEPERFDFTADYAMLYHKKYVEEIEKRDFVSGSLIWILNDFSSELRGDAVPHINNKGIRGFDRQPKESYWYYKSLWSEKPFVKIWTPFPGILISSGKKTLKIYTNAVQINLVLNGRDMGLYQAESGLIEASLPLQKGNNQLQALIPDSGLSDTLTFNFMDDPGSIESESAPVNLHISCGDHRYLWDNTGKVLWLPDQPYKPGSWGYIGGEPFKEKTRHGVKPSSDKQILDTSLDPVFQTQQKDPEEYRFDVPSGSYEITLLFAELSSVSEPANSVYNLGDDIITQDVQKSEFSVEINGIEIIESMNLIESYGSFKSIEKTLKLDIPDEGGLQIKFLKNQGHPVISGIVIRSLLIEQY